MSRLVEFVRRMHHHFGWALAIAVLVIAPVGLAAAPAKLIVKNATLFTMEKGQETPFLGYLVVAPDGAIAAVGAGDPPPGFEAQETVDATGKWILPGFISAHSHLWQSAFRGLAADQTLMGWVKAVYMENAVFSSAENYYWFTLHGALDHLQHGITGTYNFTYSGQTQSELFNEQQFKAELDSGVRFVHGINAGRIGPEWSVAQAKTAIQAFLDWTKQQPSNGRLISVMINGSGAFVAKADQTIGETILMRELGIGNQTHFLESPPDKFEERSKFRWFLDAGLLGPNLIFGHFIHTDPWILKETAKAGASMSWNPLSNGRLASGVADIPAYLKAGIRVGMGVDGQASADRADPFENMRMGLYQVRARYESASVLSPYDVLRLHTVGSADVLGAGARLGSLVAGKMADFLVFNPAELGPIFDPYASLVFVGSVTQIERIYVGGELKVSDGKLLGQDMLKISSEVAKRVKR